MCDLQERLEGLHEDKHETRERVNTFMRDDGNWSSAGMLKYGVRCLQWIRSLLAWALLSSVAKWRISVAHTLVSEAYWLVETCYSTVAKRRMMRVWEMV